MIKLRCSVLKLLLILRGQKSVDICTVEVAPGRKPQIKFSKDYRKVSEIESALHAHWPVARGGGVDRCKLVVKVYPAGVNSKCVLPHRSHLHVETLPCLLAIRCQSQK